ncbi:LCP family protein [Actinosynnema sp. NPDC053489]|uniref:LCP family protein n=1 Tax=Actinosynnema sp. NPDC053489 TaxID=3363916 RepID=UPI0037CB9043
MDNRPPRPGEPDGFRRRPVPPRAPSAGQPPHGQQPPRRGEPGRRGPEHPPADRRGSGQVGRGPGQPERPVGDRRAPGHPERRAGRRAPDQTERFADERRAPGERSRPTTRAAEPDGRRPAAPRRVPATRPRPTAGPPRRRPPERPTTGGAIFGRSLLALMSVAVLVGTGYAWANLSTLLSEISTTDVISDAGGGEKPADGSVDILMVGMDSRTDSKGNPLPQEILNELHAGNENDGGLNTDTLILMHVPNDGGKAVAVSFPRDSYVQIAGGYGRHKINSAYGYGKNDAVAKLQREGVTDPAQLEVRSRQDAAKNLIGTIENLTGVTIDHYAEINLVGFYEITKAVGGVDVCLNQATRDDMSGANFAAGQQRIQGREALAFVRQRYGLLRGDLDRIVRQQVFMAGLAKQILSAGTLSDPGKLRALIDALTKSIVLDKNWDVLRFATQMKDLTGGSLKFETIPTGNPELATPEDGTAIEVNERDVKKFFKTLSSDPKAVGSTAPTVDNAAVTVEVRNASGTPGLAARVLQSLVAERFVDGGTDNAAPLDVSVVRYGVGGEAGAEAVSEALGGLDLEQDANVPAGRVRVFVGADYSGPGAQNLAGGPLVGLDGARRQQPDTSTTTEPPITADGVRCVN